MKNLLLPILTLFGASLFAQNPSIDAFSDSYNFETEKEYTKAVDALQEVYNPTSYNINLRLGWLYYLHEEYLKSKSYYNKAIALEPKSVEAKLGLIYPLSALNNWDEVMSVYQKILDVDPHNTTSHYQLAYIYFVRKQYEKAAKHLNSVLDLYPFDYHSNALLGSVYVKLGQIKEAKSHYIKALQYDPTDDDIKAILQGL